MALVVGRPNIEATEDVYRREMEFFLKNPVFVDTATIGASRERDQALIFAGNAQSYFIGVDDTYDYLTFGPGTNPSVWAGGLDSSGTLSLWTPFHAVGDGANANIYVGYGNEVDTRIVFEGNAQEYNLGIDDTDDTFKICLNSAMGTIPILSIDANLMVAFGAAAGTPAIEYIKTTDVVTADPTTDAPNHWLQVKENAGATDYYIPVYTIDGA